MSSQKHETPRQIAERIIKQCNDLRNYQQLFEFDKQFETLARAYLELENEYYKLQEDDAESITHLETMLMEIDLRGQEIDKLKEEKNNEIEYLLSQQRETDHYIMNLKEEIERMKNETKKD